MQSFRGVVQPLAETRPAWKVLRVLGNLLQVPGFDYDSSDAVLKEALGGVDIATRLNNRLSAPASTASAPSVGLLSASPECPFISPTLSCGARRLCKKRARALRLSRP